MTGFVLSGDHPSFSVESRLKEDWRDDCHSAGQRCGCSSDRGSREHGQRRGQLLELLKDRKHTDYAMIRTWGVRVRDDWEGLLGLWLGGSMVSPHQATPQQKQPPPWYKQCVYTGAFTQQVLRAPRKLCSLFRRRGQHRGHASTYALMEHTFQYGKP